MDTKKISGRFLVKGCLFYLCVAFIFSFSAFGDSENGPLYAVAKMPTPILNTPDILSVFGGEDGKTLNLDSSGLLREVESVALPGTVFKIKEVIYKPGLEVYRVNSDEYPYPEKKGYFIDKRFVTTSDIKPVDRVRTLPPKDVIIRNLISHVGSEYVWGGDWKDGIPEMLLFYPPKGSIDPVVKRKWTLTGVDCSGLLYESTGGCTPRNTTALLTFGKPVGITGLKTPEEMIGKVEPLDLIVWKGHVIIILDRERTIESRLDYDRNTPGNQGGVRIRALKDVLEEIMSEKCPVNDYWDDAGIGEKPFVIRRWY